jgi:hypothetical protein
MFGIIKLGIIPKLVLVIVAAAGVAYLGHALTSPAPSQKTEAAADAKDISNVPPGVLQKIHEKINSTSPLLRIIIFLLIAFLLPIATIAVVRKVLAHGSNARNFLMLAAYTAADLLLAIVLVGILTTDFWARLFVILAFITGGVYNFNVLNRIEELENG